MFAEGKTATLTAGESSESLRLTFNTVGLITARGGSKGVPRKNVHLLAGKPLVAWTVEAALAANTLNRVIVSTDDAKIADCCRTAGADVPFIRPASLAGDDASHVDVVHHALDWCAHNLKKPVDAIMLLQPTSPLRTSLDIDESIASALRVGADAAVGVAEVQQHPFLVKKLTDDGGLANLLETDIAYLRRQALPTFYYPNGAIYWVRRAAFETTHSFFPPATIPYVMSDYRSLQIDTPLDFAIIEGLLASGRVFE